MQQYMSHPKHGRMPVYSQTEIDYNAKNGWVLDEEKPVLQVAYPVSRETMIEQYEAKFGKKPHHRMKQETIENALKE